MNTGENNEQISFAELGISERVLRALADVGYESASPIQAASIPPLMAGRHLVGLAQTGTGKTAAFSLPILSRIEPNASAPQALVLAPTRELALQVSEAMTRYAHYLPDVNVLAIYGGQSYGLQLAGLRRGAHVVVGTPGRVIDHLKRGTLDLSELRFLVLDEADEMLQMGFQEDVETILAEAPITTQIALFSATMPAQIRRLSSKYLTNAAEITVAAKTMTAAKTRQRTVQLANNQKLDALTRLLEVEPFEAMIVFVRTKKATEELAERLRARGFSAAAINGDLVQAQRERTIGQLKSGALDILVATDVAARGLDVERISHVLNYDIPLDSESYVHRIGRTGRAGRSGEAVTFVTPRERNLLASIEKATRQKMTPIPLPSVEDVNSSRVAKFNDAITASLESEDLSLFRGLIEKYQRENDVPIIDVAAAVALMTQDDGSFFMEPDPAPRFVRERSGGDDYAERGASRGRTASGRGDRGSERSGGDRSGGDRSGGERERSGSGPRERRSNDELATYRISVGHRQKVMPGAIVGAIANEGGLGRADFGKIEINSDHTLVELPATLSPKTIEALKATRISGVLIELERVPGGDSGARGGYSDDRPSRGGAPRSGAPRRSGGGSRGGGGPARSSGAPRKEWSKPITDDEPTGTGRPPKRNAAPGKGPAHKGASGKGASGKTFGGKAGGVGKRAATPNKDKGKPKRAPRTAS